MSKVESKLEDDRETVAAKLPPLLATAELKRTLSDKEQRSLDKAALRLQEGFTQGLAQELESGHLSGVDRPDELFILPQARYTDEKKGAGEYSVWEGVQQFLASHRKSLLILGDAGQGKTMLMKMLARRAWLDYHQAREAKGWGVIPLYIHLSRVPIARREGELLQWFLTENGLNPDSILQLRSHPLLLLLDGYDEIHPRIKCYQDNAWHEWQLRTITACRPEIFKPGERYAGYFHPEVKSGVGISTVYQELSLLLFEEKQIQAYVERYLEARNSSEGEDWSQTSTYMSYLKQIPSLWELSQTPVVLSLLIPVLPTVMAELKRDQPKVESQRSPLPLEQKRQEGETPLFPDSLREEIKEQKYDVKAQQPLPLTNQASVLNLSRARLYDIFTREWFLREKPRLLKSVTLTDPEDAEVYCRIYTENLAYQALRRGGGQVVFEAKDTLNSALLQPQDSKRCPHYDEDREALQEKKALMAFRRACLLKVSDGLFSFMHKTLIEYFTSQELFQGVYAAAACYGQVVEPPARRQGLQAAERLLHFNQQLLVDLPQVLLFLADRVREEEAFKRLLWELVYFSRQEPRASIAASNAISVLNRAGENFSGEDLSGIRIPGADLSGAMCDQTSFAGADCRRVRFWGAWLSAVDFQRAVLADTQWDDISFEEISDVLSVVYSSDGRRLAVGNAKGYIGLYGEAKGEFQRMQRLKNWSFWVSDRENNSVYSLAFSSDSQRLVAGSQDGYLRLWSVSNRCLRSVRAHEGIVYAVAYSSGGQIASGGSDCLIRLWDEKLRQPLKILRGHTESVLSVTYRPDGAQLASGSWDKTVRLWSMERGVGERVLRGHTGSVLSVTYRPDGAQLASGSGDQTVRLWSVEHGEEERVLRGHKNSVQSVTYRPDGAQLASGSKDGTVQLWSVKRGVEERVLRGHTNDVLSVTYRPDGAQLASGSWDRTVRLWSVERGVEERVLCGHTNDVLSVTYRPDGAQLASGSWDRTVRLWSVERGVEERVLRGHVGSVNSVTYHPDGGQLASGSGDQTVRLWDLRLAGVVRVMQYPSAVTALTWDQMGEQLAVGLSDGSLWAYHQKRLSPESKALVLHWAQRSSPRLFCPVLKISGALGVSPEHQVFFKQKAAQGVPAPHGTPLPPDPTAGHHSGESDEKQGLDLRLLQPLRAYASPHPPLFSAASPAFSVTYPSGVVSLMRKPEGMDPQHAFIILEAVDAFGEGLILRYDLTTVGAPLGFAHIRHVIKTGIVPAHFSEVFHGEDFHIQGKKCYALSWRVGRENLVKLYQRLEGDLGKRIPYHIAGGQSLFAQSRSASEAENCFTWARKHLCAIDEPQIQRELAGKRSDTFGAVTSFYIKPVGEEKVHRDPRCAVM
jgi:WD40 repeat protein